jgi:hypothetical protein
MWDFCFAISPRITRWKPAKRTLRPTSLSQCACATRRVSSCLKSPRVRPAGNLPTPISGADAARRSRPYGYLRQDESAANASTSTWYEMASSGSSSWLCWRSRCVVEGSATKRKFNLSITSRWNTTSGSGCPRASVEGLFDLRLVCTSRLPVPVSTRRFLALFSVLQGAPPGQSKDLICLFYCPISNLKY